MSRLSSIRSSLVLVLLACVLQSVSVADPARAKQKWGLGVEGLGRTIAPSGFLDYCVFPRLALGGSYGFFRANDLMSNRSASLLAVYANFYFRGSYWADYITFGRLFAIGDGNTAQNIWLPGIGIEYRSHGGFLFRTALYLLTSTCGGPSWLTTPIGTLWPGISLGLALWPGHSD